MEYEMDTEESIISEFFKTPKEYNFHSAQDVINAAKELPWDEEGYVVVDADFNRVKIKSPRGWTHITQDQTIRFQKSR